jgi:hypothetical protein
MAGVLDRLVRLIRQDPAQTALTYPWHQLRYEHTQLIRTKLAEHATPRQQICLCRRSAASCESAGGSAS